MHGRRGFRTVHEDLNQMKIDESLETIIQIKIELENLDNDDLLDRWISFSIAPPMDRIIGGDKDVLERGILEIALIRRFGMNYSEIVERRRRRMAHLQR